MDNNILNTENNKPENVIKPGFHNVEIPKVWDNNEVSALNNCLSSCNLNGYKIREYQPQDKRKVKPLYFLTDDKGTSLTGYWDYSKLNHFIMGYGKACKKYDKLKEQNNSLLEALKDITYQYIETAKLYSEDNNIEYKEQSFPSIEKAIKAIQKTEQ